MATRTFNISLPDELVKQIDELAKKSYMSRSELIKHALIKKLNENENEWQTVVDLTHINKRGVSAADILEALQ